MKKYRIAYLWIKSFYVTAETLINKGLRFAIAQEYAAGNICERSGMRRVH